MANNGKTYGPKNRFPGVPSLPPPPGMQFGSPLVTITIQIDGSGNMKFAANVPVPIAQTIGIFAEMMVFQCNYAIQQDSKLVGSNKMKSTLHAEIVKDLAEVIKYHSQQWLQSGLETVQSATENQENGNRGNDTGSSSGNENTGNE